MITKTRHTRSRVRPRPLNLTRTQKRARAHEDMTPMASRVAGISSQRNSPTRRIYCCVSPLSCFFELPLTVVFFLTDGGKPREWSLKHFDGAGVTATGAARSLRQHGRRSPRFSLFIYFLLVLLLLLYY